MTSRLAQQSNLYSRPGKAFTGGSEHHGFMIVSIAYYFVGFEAATAYSGLKLASPQMY